MDISKMENLLDKSLSLKINRMFNNRVPSHWGFRDRINQDQHLIYVKGGEGYYILNNEEIPLVRGQLIFVSRGTLHTAGFRGTNHPQIMPLRFSFYSEGNPVDYIVSKPFSLVKTLVQREYAESLMNKLFSLSTLQLPSPVAEKQMDSLLRLLLYLFLEEEVSGNINDPRIAAALKKIHSSPWKKHSLSKMAEESNLSQKQFSRLFRNETGRSPVDYLRFFRCQYAAEELNSTSRSVQDIARDLGYPDPYTFSKQFKKYMGSSPRHWRVGAG